VLLLWSTRPCRLLLASSMAGTESDPVDVSSPTAPTANEPLPGRVTLLHLSDTHNLHRTIEKRFPMPSADILIHTGDWSDQGTAEEAADFNSWLGELRPRYKHIVVIAGNHEWRALKFAGRKDAIVAAAADSSKTYISRLLTNATVLEHEGVTLMGLNIFGSCWDPAALAQNPDQPDMRSEGTIAVLDRTSRSGCQFDAIPAGTDVLLTHGPPIGIFDMLEGQREHWGSSERMARRIEFAKPAAHLFGHLHEQRGVWHRASREAAWQGGVEYERVPGKPFITWDPPPIRHPCTLISCNAMKNHPTLDGKPPSIVGGGRLIVATPEVAAEGATLRKAARMATCWPGAENVVWRFDVVNPA